MLAALCDAKAPVEKSSLGLGRSPTSIAHRASDTGLTLPKEWHDLITRRQAAKPRAPRSTLQYPYLLEAKGEHASLLEVNALIPRGLPDHIRADVCQEIMLALWERDTSLEELRADKALVRKFMNRARNDNYELGGYALSLDQPMRDGRSWYDVLPDQQIEY